MSGDAKAFVIVLLGFFACVATVAWAIAWYNVRSIEEFARNGYSMGSVMGRGETVWVKSRQPEEFVPPPAPVEGESVEVLP